MDGPSDSDAQMATQPVERHKLRRHGVSVREACHICGCSDPFQPEETALWQSGPEGSRSVEETWGR